MACSKCGGNNIQVIGEVSGKTYHRSIGQKFIRGMLILCTAGLWLLVPARTGRTKTKTKFVCIDCKNQWY